MSVTKLSLSKSARWAKPGIILSEILLFFLQKGKSRIIDPGLQFVDKAPLGVLTVETRAFLDDPGGKKKRQICWIDNSSEFLSQFCSFTPSFLPYSTLSRCVLEFTIEYVSVMAKSEVRLGMLLTPFLQAINDISVVRPGFR